MEVEIVNNQEQFRKWYQGWIDEMRSHIVEARTASAWTLICAYHAIGSSIVENKKRLEDNGIRGEAIVTKTAKSLGINQAYAYDCVRFAEKYPKLEDFTGDKAMTWNKLRVQYLMTPEQQEKHNAGKVCPKCGYNFKEKK